MRQRLVALAKLTVSVSIVAYLVYDVQHRDPHTFTRLRHEPMDWTLLAAAWACFVSALLLGWMRWRSLAAALGLHMHARDAARLGFFGYMLDFLALGTMGGDLGRAVLLGREHGRRWTAALASVAADRLVGLWALSMAAATGVVLARPAAKTAELATVSRAVFAVATASSISLALLMVPSVREAVTNLLVRIVPRLGSGATRILDSLRAYRERGAALPRVALMSLGVPTLNVAGFFLITRALPLRAPSLLEHFVIIPPAMVSGAIPLPMEALGVFEYTVNYLYGLALPAGSPPGTGLLIALTYRALTILTILAGAPLYAWVRAGR